MKVTLNRGLFRWITVCLVGAVLLIYSSVIRDRYRKAEDFQTLSLANLEAGTYVTGEITEFLVSNQRASSAELIAASKDYEFYTVPVANGGYIRIAVYTRESQAKIDARLVDKEHPLKFVGRVVKSPISLNYDWYEFIPGFDVTSVEKTYIVMESDYEPMIKIGQYGLAILLCGVVFLLAGLYSRYIHYTDEKEIAVNVRPSGLTPELEYVSDLKTYDILEQRLKDKHRTHAIFLTLALLALLALIAPYNFENSKILWLTITVISLFSSGRSLLHFDNKACRKISAVFGIDSVGIRMHALREDMKRLQSLLAKKDTESK